MVKDHLSNDNTALGSHAVKNPKSVIFLSAPKGVIWRFLLKCFAAGVFCNKRFLRNFGGSCIVVDCRLIFPSKQHKPDNSTGYLWASERLNFFIIPPIITSGFWPCVKSCLVGGSDKYNSPNYYFKFGLVRSLWLMAYQLFVGYLMPKLSF